ncbi:MAG: molecular chaperone TorD family protein [Coriobacteriales bacterium]|jgi:TorA maturation chaperone TorD|nr:molecular chaperone TorD family protein [Coriobacteriales bacterium]
MSNDRSLQVLLAARNYGYTFFHSLLGNEPSLSQLDCLGDDIAIEALLIFGADSRSEFFEALQMFEESLDVLTRKPMNGLEALREEYTRLFIGPQKLLAPPWESFYLDEGHSLFQRSTLSVRSFYQSHGYRPQGYPVIADDHLALEVGFLSCLARDAYDAFEQNDYHKTRNVLLASRDFLDDHLMVWMPLYQEGLAKVENKILFPQAVRLLSEFLKRDREELYQTLLGKTLLGHPGISL